MNLFQESSLNDSIVFSTINKQSILTSTIVKCIKSSIVIEEKHIEEQLIQINRTRLSPLVDKVLSAYNKGDIVILYSKVTKVPQAVPFVILKSEGKVKAYIFISNYCSLVDNKQVGGEEYLNIPMKDLYVLMEGAYTALSYNTYPISITKNLGLMRITSNVYTSMIMRIFNKEYALSMDINVYNRVSYCVSRFYLEKIWGSNNEEINNAYAIGNILNPNKMDLLIIKDSYDNATINNIQDLLNFLKTVSPRLEKLNMRYFTDCYIRTYKAGALFGMECLPYFLYTMECSLIGSFLVNQPILSDIYKNTKNINLFYAELTKAL